MPHFRGPGRATAAVLLAGALLACRENLQPTGAAVASVRIAPDLLTIAQGDTATLVATVRNASGEVLHGVPIAWTSSDTAVAAVGPGGLVRGGAAGLADILAVAERDTGTARVTVVARIAAVRVVPSQATLVPGGTFPLAALALDPSGVSLGPRTAAWTSTDTTVVRVAPEGTAQAAGTGTAWVVARLGERRDSARIRVVLVAFTAVSAGPYESTCATGPLGAFCWGNEASAGNLGAGTRLDLAAAPVGVTGGDRFATVSAGDAFTCGLSTEGAPFCWGSGAYGRLGDGTVDSVRVAPVPVVGGPVLRALSAGRRHACGLADDGRVSCWGGNSTGALGIPSTTDHSPLPVVVETDRAFVSVGAGYLHTCGLAADSTAYCWGRGFQLGDSLGVSRPRPAPVYGGHRFAALSVGWNHTCGLATDGAVWCWGYNLAGELGRATDMIVTVPVSVAGGPAFVSVTAGFTATCGLTADGSAYCWGWNNAGQLGTGDTVGGPTPRPVAGGLRFTTLSVGNVHSCGLATDGLLYCWGSRERGMLGDGTEAGFSTTPVAVNGQRGAAPARNAQR
jgi:alpha-tubulin suppressor-like RCC1 family protein